MKDVRWGIVGCGDVAERKSGPALYGVENSSVVAVMSRKEEKAKGFAERHGVSKYYTDADELIADPDVNAVYIGTPPSAHPEFVLKAAKAGKHVLCEKPMSPSVTECRKMIDACRKAEVQLMIAFYRRFYPVVIKMKDLLADGVIGEPTRVHATCGFYSQITRESERAWFIDPAISGGGFLVDVATHRLDLMTMFFGAAAQVGAFVGTQTLDIDVDDASSLLIKFQGGIHGSLLGNWNSGANTDYFEIQGTKGRMYSHNLSSKGELKVETIFGNQEFSLPSPKPVHLYLVDHFVQSLLSNTPNSLDGDQGILATQITEAAYESAQSQKIVSL